MAAAAESEPVTSINSYYYIDWNDFEVKSVDSMDDERFIKTQKVIRVLDCYKDLTPGVSAPRDIRDVRLDKYQLALILGYDNEIAEIALGYELNIIEAKIREYFMNKGLIEVKNKNDMQASKIGVEIAFEESGKSPEAYLKDVQDENNNLKIGRSFANVLDTGPSKGQITRSNTYYELFEDIGISLCLNEQLKNFGFDNCSLEVKYVSQNALDFCLTIDGEIMETMKDLQMYAIGNKRKNSWIRKMIAKEHIDKLVDSNSTKQVVLTILRVLFKIKAMGDTLQVIMLNENIDKRGYKQYYLVSGDKVVHDSLMLINKNSIYKHDEDVELFTVPLSTTIDDEIKSFEKSFERIETLNNIKIQKLTNAYKNKNSTRGTQIFKPNGQLVLIEEIQLLLGKMNSHIEVLKYFNDLILYVAENIKSADQQESINFLLKNKMLMKKMNLLDKLQIKGRKQRNRYTLVGVKEFTELLDEFNRIHNGIIIKGGNKKRSTTTSDDIYFLENKKRSRKETNNTTKLEPTKLEPFMEEERTWLNNEWENATREILRLYYDENQLGGKDIDNQILIQASKLFIILLDNEETVTEKLIAENDINKKNEQNLNYGEESYVQLDTVKEKERLRYIVGMFIDNFSPYIDLSPHIKIRGGNSKIASKYLGKKKTKKKRKYNSKRRTHNNKRFINLIKRRINTK